MGRKTFESIGKPLPNRKNIVVTTQKQISFPAGVEVIHDLSSLQNYQEEHPSEEIFVIGGGHIFEQILPFADRMYITYIDEAFQGDTYFPPFPASEWKLISEREGERDNANPYKYYFRQYDRK
ncbi:dihydrofolate reductase [Virgibacillus halophilus]|uniref:dihydrofolate reductase n=3 Tax=Tigheibacillus halophilus TaxID=361280 RepID=A0ABU5CDB2_9BACI|nr:dihydrofolate reductase [Virgibacillus halophilus]